MQRVCVIGAGSSGIASCQVLHERGVPFDCFEVGSAVGGNWRFRNDNGMSSAYRSLHINTSRELMEYAKFPMPRDYPDYPHHSQIAAYFDAYVDHFGFRGAIRFRTEVIRVEPLADGGFEVRVRGVDDGAEETRRYGAVLVANGHHWDPKWPDYPGEFHGEVVHSHDYETPEGYEGEDVLVVGFGNSAMDIACETSRVSRMTYLSVRRGAHVIPKYVKGKPVDQLPGPLMRRMPFRLQRFLFSLAVRQAQGRMEDYGLPKPDHRFGEAHPTISSEILTRIGHGRVTVKPDVARLEGEAVRFTDGSVERISRIVYCTGYRITLPFLAPDVMSAEDNRVSLYKRVVHPEVPGLYFIGLLQPLGAIMPLAEAQSEWVADLVQGRVALPERSAMERAIERDRRAMARRYVASTRHTIQVDFDDYMRQVARERRRRRGRRAALRAAPPERAPAGAAG